MKRASPRSYTLSPSRKTWDTRAPSAVRRICAATRRARSSPVPVSPTRMNRAASAGSGGRVPDARTAGRSATAPSARRVRRFRMNSGYRSGAG